MRRILIVQDDEATAASMQRRLSGIGHAVEVAHTPEAAVSVATHFMPEVAVLDVVLRDIDGRELARRLRTHVRPMHLIAVTAYPLKMDTWRSVGFIDSLVKPVDVQQLARMLEELTPP